MGTILLGLQWGDEGKGKITDYLAEKMDYVVRFQGGDNAGHTIKIDKNYFFNHLIPSGIMYPNVQCVIGNGVVVNPEMLLKEINTLKEKNISTKNLFISDKCNIIMDFHIALDSAKEGKDEKIGTTKRGIGPTYRDKIARIGIRFCDFENTGLAKENIKKNLKFNNFILKNLYGKSEFDPKDIYKKYEKYYKQLLPHIRNTEMMLFEACKEGKKILFEGAQGTFLDIDFGTYPFVTSSNTTAGGAITGTGFPITSINKVVGVVKAYTTRVGNGPFPTELNDETGDKLAEKGKEFGTTTGRQRRVGWLDLVMLRYAVKINGITGIAITKLDVLNGLSRLKVCTEYRLNNKKIKNYPSNYIELEGVTPVYKDFDGWGAFDNIESLDELPENAKKYLKFIEKYLEVPIEIISFGAGRRNTIEI